MFAFLRRKELSLLVVKLNGKAVCSIAAAELSCEKNPAIQLEANSVLELIDAKGHSHRHELGESTGWFHFSIRVHPNLACQADCVITDAREYDPDAFSEGRARGIRFQPFFISGASVANDKLYGQGLFARGLHFSGNITPGNTILSCVCDRCQRSFQIHSYHSGFSNTGYFYSDSGRFTITVHDRVPGCPAALAELDPVHLATLEAKLPRAPDGTSYRYANPFRCPHCSAPYIDFDAYPKNRQTEYYGNYFVGSELLRYEFGD